MTELDVEVADDPSSVGRSAAARGAPVTAASRTVCQIHVLDVESERWSMRLAMKLA